MTQINGFGAYQNTMMNALNQKQKADADKTAKKAEEQEKIRAARRNERADKSDKTAGTKDTEVQLSDKAKALLEELKSKYGNMDFFIADYSTEEEAQSLSLTRHQGVQRTDRSGHARSDGGRRRDQDEVHGYDRQGHLTACGNQGSAGGG